MQVPFHLRESLFYVAGIVTVTVIALLIYSLIRFKRDDNYEKSDKQPNLKVELLWMLVPFLMLIIMAFPVIKGFYAKEQQIHKQQWMHKKDKRVANESNR